MSRKALFDFARPLAPGGKLTDAMVTAGNAFADALGLPREDGPALASEEAFFAAVRREFGGLKQSQVDGFKAVLAAMKGWPLSWQAYGLATAWHETGATMQPVREAFNLSEAWRKKNLRYWPHYGRGLVQITWPKNYEWLDRAAAEAGLTKPGEILANLDLAMRPDIAALALRRGLEEGRYDAQGKRMAQRLPNGPATREQYVNARYLVNVQDKAGQIADYALKFEKALTA